MAEPLRRALWTAQGAAYVSVAGWNLDGLYLSINDNSDTPGVALAVFTPDEARSLIEALGAAIKEVERAG